MTLRRGIDFQRAGRLAEAEGCYREVLVGSPSNVDALNLLAVVRQSQGRAAEALALFDQAVAAGPRAAIVHYNRARTLEALGRPSDARQSYRTAIELKPDYVEAYLNLGVLEHSAGNLEAAVEIFQKVVAFAPSFAPGHFNLGRCWLDRKDFAAAEHAFKTALQLQPDYFDALIMLAKCHADRDRYSQAADVLNRALTLQPRSPLALTNLGTYLTYQDRHEDALLLFEKALASDPDYHSARVNRGLANLVMGHLGQGWDDLWYRAESAGSFEFRKLDLPWPRWQGEPLHGKRLFLWGEQGLGDEILFSSVVAEVAATTATITFGCAPRLVSLFRRSFPAVRVEPLKDVLKDVRNRQFDYHSSLLDLGRWRRRELESFPRRAAFLTADPALVTHHRAHGRKRHDPAKKLIGFSWRSFAAHVGHLKTPALEAWQALRAAPALHLINLQYGPREHVTADALQLRSFFGEQFSEPEVPNLNDNIDALAAYVSVLDGIVTVSNTLAHLAGSLGIPALVLVPEGKARLWYWFKEGDVSPWYPSVRIVRSPALLSEALPHVLGRPSARL